MICRRYFERIFGMGCVVFTIASCGTRDNEMSKSQEASSSSSDTFTIGFAEPEFDNEYESFWEENAEFGVARVKDRLVLVSKSKDVIPQLLNEIASFSNLSVNLAEPQKKSPVKGGFAFDITKVISQKISQTHLRFADNRVNCWNYALFMSGIYRGISNTNDLEFKHWMQSPLVEPVLRHEDLRPGDIIAYRARKNVNDQETNELHGAIFVSKNWMLAKNGAHESKPMRLVSAEVVNATYLRNLPRYCALIGSVSNNSCKYYVEAFRPISFETFVSTKIRNKEVKLIVDQFALIEADSTLATTEPFSHTIDDETEQKFLERSQKRKDAKNRVERGTSELYKKVKSMLNNSQNLDANEQYLLKGLYLRARSINLNCDLGNCD